MRLLPLTRRQPRHGRPKICHLAAPPATATGPPDQPGDDELGVRAARSMVRSAGKTLLAFAHPRLGTPRLVLPSPWSSLALVLMENRMQFSKPWRQTAFATALLACTALTGPGASLPAHAQPGPVNPPAMAAPQAVLPDFSALVARVKPAVVSITTTMKMEEDDDQGVPIPLASSRSTRWCHMAGPEAEASASRRAAPASSSTPTA